MERKKQRKYFRITKAERVSIERAVDKNQSVRSIARDLSRAPAAITEEIKRNRTVCKGPGKGERVEHIPEDACIRLTQWPGICNGCKYRRYHCSKKWRCEYCATKAQSLSDGLLAEARRGVNAANEINGFLYFFDRNIKLFGDFDELARCDIVKMVRHYDINKLAFFMGRCKLQEKAFAKIASPDAFRLARLQYFENANDAFRRQPDQMGCLGDVEAKVSVVVDVPDEVGAYQSVRRRS